MKQKLFFLLAFLLGLHQLAGAQNAPYGNEWIDYSKTYYKFKVGADGAVRILRSVLDAAGLPASVKGSNFMLYREGREVPLTASADVMTGSDYLEFWGRKADGKFDAQLYVLPSAQADSRVSLFTDTACYYLTWDAGSSHQRYTDATSPITGSPTPLAYCIATVGTHFRSGFSSGAIYDPLSVFPAAEFDQGEGFVDIERNISLAPQTQFTIATPNAMTSAPAPAVLNMAILTQSFGNPHEALIKLNNVQIADSVFGTSESKHFSIAVPASGITASNNVLVSMINVPSGIGIDRYGISYIEMVYPRNFDMTGLPSFSCVIPASSSAQYIEFLNFSGAQPRLYDSANNAFYNGDVSVSGKVRFYLQPSLQDRPVLLYSTSATPALALDKSIHFQDFGAPASQASYLIITNKALRQGSSDYIKDFAAYRHSATGGGYDTAITHIGDLYDAFAYGYDIHPLAIQNYLRFAYDNWTAKKLQYVTLIGRGILYSEHAAYYANPVDYNFPIVPTYGDPGSDVAFVNWGNKQMKMAIGRISVWNGAEVGAYLQKVMAYEAALKPAPSPSVASEYWKKRALHIVSGADTTEQGLLERSLATAGTIITDTLTGYHISVAGNDAYNHAPNPLPNSSVDSLINSGIQLLTYFGHASSSGFQFALNNPEGYTNSPRLPFFLALGCDVSQMFALSKNRTISERWVLAPGGAVAEMASDNLGYPDDLSIYLGNSYRNIAYKSYGTTLGMQVKNSNNDAMNYAFQYGLGRITQIENLIYDGDPALSLYSAPKPDYHIPSDELAAIPGNVSTSTDSFKLRINAYNLARAVRDTVLVEVRHRAPGSSTNPVISSYRLANLFNSHTDYVWVPVNKLTDLGLNTYTVTIDADNKVDETSEINNTGTFTLFIYSDNLIPVYPKEFAIVYQQGVTLKASTLNPFRPSGRYRMQLDTTMLFNSPLKQETVVTAPGGVIKWKPALTMQDSVVYYWRTAFDSAANGTDVQWTASSFIYLAQGSPGWNQSHYYQYRKNSYNNVLLDSDRTFKYTLTDNGLIVKSMILNSSTQAEDVEIDWKGSQVQRGPWPYDHSGSVQISVIDSLSGKWWLNNAAQTLGATPPVSALRGTWTREFITSDVTGRLAAAHYLDSIPNGNYVMIRNVFWLGQSLPNFISVLRSDSAANGGKSLYHSIKALGFDKIDSFTSARAFIFLRRKGYNNYPVQQLITDSNNLYQMLNLTTTVPGYGNHGAINSTVIGPASSIGNGWQSLKWKTFANDGAPQNDSVSVAIYGIDSLGAETYLCCRDRGHNRFIGVGADTSLAFISSQRYPNIRLVWASADSITNTPPQAGFWRVLYAPVPEAALNPGAYLAWSDSLHQGQTENLSVAIENLTELPMDSMLVRFKIIDANGNARATINKRYRPLPGNDTLHATLSFDPAPYPGANNIFIEANPDNDQREQYHPNNLGYLPLKVLTDKSNPLLDVTFDGQHILDGDIVSSKPFIRVLLKDENEYLPLNDTSLVSVALLYPDSASYNATPIHFDGVTAKFIPATTGANGRNEAVIELRPNLTRDGRYTLLITGKDRAGNTSGLAQGANALAKYEVAFEVVNKPMITNVLNYPNPFSTSTAFIFTLTGAQIPSQFKIQIMTVTGKVVREITKGELGPLHIGRNITDYKWDGKDQYGQMLGNGVYMYRVATAINGNDMERFEGTGNNNNGDGAGSNIDEYFKHGWGKMYIMR